MRVRWGASDFAGESMGRRQQMTAWARDARVGDE